MYCQLFGHPSGGILAFNNGSRVRKTSGIVGSSGMHLSFESVAGSRSEYMLQFMGGGVIEGSGLMRRVCRRDVVTEGLYADRFLTVFVSCFFMPGLLTSSACIVISVILLLVF